MGACCGTSKTKGEEVKLNTDVKNVEKLVMPSSFPEVEPQNLDWIQFGATTEAKLTGTADTRLKKTKARRRRKVRRRRGSSGLSSSEGRTHVTEGKTSGEVSSKDVSLKSAKTDATMRTDKTDMTSMRPTSAKTDTAKSDKRKGRRRPTDKSDRGRSTDKNATAKSSHPYSDEDEYDDEDEDDEDEGTSNIDGNQEGDHFPFAFDVAYLKSIYAIKRVIRLQENDTVVYHAASYQVEEENDVAIKLINDPNYSEAYKPREVRILHILGYHICIPRLLKWYAFWDSGTYSIVLPFIYAGKVNVKEPSSICRYVFSLLLGLRHCHSKGVFYGDVKPDNLLWAPKERQGYLIDYDCAREYEPHNPPRGIIGTRNYRAPEVEQEGSPSGYAADIYSAGIVFFELLFDVQPRGECTHAYMMEELGEVSDYSSGHRLVAEMLRFSPASRITARDALEHEYFRALRPPYAEADDSLAECYLNTRNSDDYPHGRGERFNA